MRITPLTLCLVTQINDKSLEEYLTFIQQAIQGGVTSIQLRDKTNPPLMVRQIALALKACLSPLGIPLIINDDVNLAKEIDAEGVHLGQSDLSPVEARQILGPHKMIGWSIETEEQLQRANQFQCIDYIGASAIFPSSSKQNCKMIWGLDGLKRITEQSKHPVVAIGGINATNIRQIMAHGACGAAVISALHDYEQPETSAAALIQQIHLGNQDVRTN